MTILQALNHLLEDVLGEVFFQLPPLPDIVEEVSTSAQLHGKDDMLVGLEGIKKLDDILVLDLLENDEFLHHLLLRGLVLIEEVLVDGFYGHQLLCELVDCQIYPPKSPFPKHLPYSVVVRSGLGRLFELPEAYFDQFGYPVLLT
mmetsp:Transcript_29172/g.28226  ORF Transcript_29172/g.28226 Transcript_29172/m.28226 type:complete len:145 (-) Transcript_29172:2702-3136(-)